METLIGDFGRRLAETKGVGLFYYAGHGVTSNGQNYLIPVDANIPDEDLIKYKAVPVGYVLDKMSAAKNSFNLVILDACRNNPFARQWRSLRDINDSKGLANSNPPRGTLVLYATQPGGTSIDGVGGSKNGLFTQALLKQIKEPNLELDQLVKVVARDVEENSKQKQSPWKEGLYSGDFYFAGLSKETKKETVPVKDETLTEKDKATVEREAWSYIKNSSDPQDFRDFLKDFPTGTNANNAKIRLEQTAWEAVKDSKDKAKITAYLNEFQNGVNAPLARIKLRQLETAATVTNNPTNPTSNNTTANRMAGAISKAKLPNGAEMSFAYIPAGEFQMGSNNESDEKPIHTVKISQGYFMGQTEVTQAQWQAVMGNNPSSFKDCPQCPVEQVSWEDAQQFIAKLNAQNDGFKYRLPTEAEWEYAARAGTTGDYAGNVDSMAWYSSNSGNKTHEVGTKQANGWNLYDMHGNVWEWCQDWYDAGYYAKSPTTDPTGAATGSFRVGRGGGWGGDGGDLRSAFRSNGTPSGRGSGLGFRLIRK